MQFNKLPRRTARSGWSLTVLLILCGTWAGAQERAPADGADLGANADAGEVQVAPFLLPASGFSSPQAQAALAEMIKSAQSQRQAPGASVPERRARRDKELEPALEEARRLYPVTVTPRILGGVPVDEVAPAAGVAPRNRGRVLIELAGGAFTTATATGGILESVPVAGLGGLRVMSLHYRQGPEYRFPSASEDVAAVYQELLKHYKAKAIGIYGCSSGAYLTTMSLAWFQSHRLPTPGAIALLCGSAGRIFEGDSFFTGAALMGHPAPRPVTPNNPVVQVDYMRDIKATDPLAMPVNFPDVLAKFPPTLIITGTRDVALSSAVFLHSRLVALGVKADLHVWDGMWHGFMNFPALPETRQAAEVISKFFDQELTR